MTFDRIDRQFRRPEPIKLECVDCNTTKDVVVRPAYGDTSEPICPSCLQTRSHQFNI